MTDGAGKANAVVKYVEEKKVAGVFSQLITTRLRKILVRL